MHIKDLEYMASTSAEVAVEVGCSSSSFVTLTSRPFDPSTFAGWKGSVRIGAFQGGYRLMRTFTVYRALSAFQSPPGCLSVHPHSCAKPLTPLRASSFRPRRTTRVPRRGQNRKCQNAAARNINNPRVCAHIGPPQSRPRSPSPLSLAPCAPSLARRRSQHKFGRL